MNVVNYLENTKYGFVEKLRYDSVIKRLISIRDINQIKHDGDSEDTEGESIIMSCKFSKVRGTEDTIAVANEDGIVRIGKIRNRVKQITSFRARNNAVFDMAWCDVDNRLIIGSGDHSVSLWDLNGGSAQLTGEFSEHTKSVKSVCFVPQERCMFASGARDGLILLWDTRIATQNSAKIKPCNTIKSYHWYSPGNDSRRGRIKKAATGADSISALLFQNSTTLFSSSVGEGVVKVWDIRKFYSAYKRIPQPVHSLTHPKEKSKYCFTSLALDPCGMRLYANCVDHSIYCYNVASFSNKPVAKYTGHEVYSLYIKCCLSPDGHYLISGSSDFNACIWRTDKPNQPVVSLNGHNSEVTCVDWSRSDGVTIATCSDDSSSNNTVMPMIWRVDDENIRDMPSHESNCVGRAQEIMDSVPSDKVSYQTPRRMKINPLTKDFTSPMSATESPTSNLPNYVIDGTSPHHQCSKSYQKENRNWLLDLKNKTPPAQSLTCPRIGQKRPRQHNPKVCGNLLKFFKVAVKQQSPTAPCSQLNNNNINNTSSTDC